MDTVKKIFSFRMLTMLMMGYCSGLPLLLTGGTLQAWMTDEKIDLTAIGMVSLIGMPYVLKFLWAPFLDRYQIPVLGRRKGWMIIFQILILVSIFGLSMSNPTTSLTAVLGWAFCIALFSASQDVVVDAYRRELMPDEELGLASSLYVNGYRLAMIVSGSLALNMADSMPFSSVYKIMALCMIPAILFTIIAPKENHHIKIPSNMKEAVIGPLQEFFTRKGAFIVLLFILLYKVGDSMAANMTTPFILQMGYTKSDLGNVAKLFGLVSTIIGGLIGGVMMLKYNMKWSLIFFGILQAVSTIGFAILPSMPITLSSLAIVVAFENLASGMGTAAYAAYMASLTNKRFTATQYALLTALMGVPRVILASPTGKMAEMLGWEMFFVVCTLVAIPGLLLLIPVFRLERPKATA
jgi:PAT family beta-lactamase induction signal transducer AmpG